MDKRFFIAAALSMVIWFGWYLMFPPPERPRPTPADNLTEQTEAVDKKALPFVETDERDPAQELTAAPSDDDVPSVQADVVEEVRFANELFELVMTNDGARVVSWKLRDYTTKDGQPLELIPQFTDGAPEFLLVSMNDSALRDLFNQAIYKVEREPVYASDGFGPGERIRFRWADGRGLEAVKSLTFREQSYLVDLEFSLTDRGRPLDARMQLGPGFGAQESMKKSTYHYTGQGAWNVAGSVTRKKPGSIVKESGGVTGSVIWAGLEDQYFAALIVPGTDRSELAWEPVERTPVPLGDAESVKAIKQAIFSVSVPAEGAKLYVGPKKYKLLRSLGYELEKSVWFASSNFLGTIAKFIFLCLLWIHDHTIANYGLAIILATFLLRLILFPINQYSMVSMKKSQLQMQRLQPKIKGIRAKYKKSKDAESRGKMNQEMMDLYKREGVNPMGGLSGCLPLLAQFPILIGFYNMLTVAVELRGAPFVFWIQDLSVKDPWFVTPLLMGVTMFTQQKMAMSKVKDPVQQQQQKFMMFMPVIFTYICIQMPAGMVLYWFVNNLLGMGQQWLVNRHTTKLEAAAQKA